MSREDYPLGYGAGAQSWLLARTHESQAGFFLPYLRPGMRLVDVACGPGVISLGLAGIVAPGEVIGLDVERSQVEHATKAAEEKGVRNVRFEAADIYDIPFGDATFDAAFAGAILGHLRSPTAALREIRRVLKPGGTAGFREFDHGGDIFYPVGPAIAESIELYHRFMSAGGKHRDSGRRLKGWLNEAGLEVIEAGATYDVADPARYAAQSVTLFKEQLAEQLKTKGHADDAKLARIYAAWEEMADNPDAFIAGAWVHAVARRR